MAADSTRLRHIEPYKVREIDDCAALAPLLFVAGVKRRVYLATINQPRRSTNGTNNTRVSSIDFNTFYLILFLPSHLFFINDETRFQTRVVFYRVFDEAFEKFLTFERGNTGKNETLFRITKGTGLSIISMNNGITIKIVPINHRYFATDKI